MIPSIVKTPISLVQTLAGGVLRVGLGGMATVLHKVLPGGDITGQARERTHDAHTMSETVVDITPPESVHEAPVRKTAAKKATPKKSAPKKSAATLNEPLAPVDDDLVVYSSGPDA